MKIDNKRAVMVDAIEAYRDEFLYSYMGRYMSIMGMSDASDDFYLKYQMTLSKDIGEKRKERRI